MRTLTRSHADLGHPKTAPLDPHAQILHQPLDLFIAFLSDPSEEASWLRKASRSPASSAQGALEILRRSRAIHVGRMNREQLEHVIRAGVQPRAPPKPASLHAGEALSYVGTGRSRPPGISSPGVNWKTPPSARCRQ